MGSYYRRIDVSLWGDERFRQLTSPAPCGQWLWVWLLTGPCTTMVPGLLLTGKRAAAEALGWSDRNFARCWGQVEGLGMATADWKHGVVWIPRALRYNPPPNLSAVRAWPRELGRMPECSLRGQVLADVEAALRERGAGFLDAFHAAAGAPGGALQPTPTPTPIPIPTPTPRVGAQVGAQVAAQVGGQLEAQVGTDCDDTPECSQVGTLLRQVLELCPARAVSMTTLVRDWADNGVARTTAEKALKATIKARPTDPVAYATAVVERTESDERRRGMVGIRRARAREGSS
jgi:hypothetical protein